MKQQQSCRYIVVSQGEITCMGDTTAEQKFLNLGIFRYCYPVICHLMSNLMQDVMKETVL